MKKVLWVTGFKDIGRSTWHHSSVDTEKYIEWFNRISNLENLICFCDDQTLPKIKEKTNLQKENILNIEEIKTFYNDELYDIQINILKNEDFINKIPAHLRASMQYHEPKYNLTTYTKFSLIKKASELYPDYTHYAWIDFGFAKNHEDSAPDKIYFNLIPEDKIYVSSACGFGYYENQNPTIIIKNSNLYYSFLYDWTSMENFTRNPQILVQGNMWFVPKNLTHWLENQIIESMNEWHRNNLVSGHEEPLWLNIIHKNSNFIKINIKPEWRSWNWI